MQPGSIVKCIFDYMTAPFWSQAVRTEGLKVPNMVDDYTIEIIGEGLDTVLNKKMILLTLVEVDNNALTDLKGRLVAFPAEHFVELLPPFDVKALFEEAKEEELVT